jgi:hypothetical protein
VAGAVAVEFDVAQSMSMNVRSGKGASGERPAREGWRAGGTDAIVEPRFRGLASCCGGALGLERRGDVGEASALGVVVFGCFALGSTFDKVLVPEAEAMPHPAAELQGRESLRYIEVQEREIVEFMLLLPS